MVQSKDRQEDDRLVAQAMDGSQEAFRQLYDRYHRKIYNLVASMVGSKADVDDIVQQTFIRAFRSLGSFRGMSSFYTWLYRVTINTTTDYRRKQFRRSQRETLELDAEDEERPSIQLQAPEEDSPEEQLYRKELAGIIRRAMESLSPEHREVLLLREINGLNYAEIAETVGIEPGTVMSRLFYARRKLAEILQSSNVLKEG